MGLLGCAVVMVVLPLNASAQPEDATDAVRAREIAFAQTMADRDFEAFSSGPVFDAQGTEVGRFNSIWRLDPDGVWRIVFDRGS